MGSPKPVRSWSQYSLYMKCPQLFYYQYIDRSVIRKASFPLHVGSSVHLGHEFLCKKKLEGKEVTLKEVKEEVEVYWESKKEEFSQENLSTFLLEKTKVMSYVETYFHYFVNNDITPLHTEKDVLWEPKGYNFIIRGIIDRIDADHTLVDLKTSKRAPPKSKATGEYYINKDYGYDIQLDIYAWLMRESLNIEPKAGCLEFLVKTKSPKVIPVKVDLKEDKLNSTLDLLANLEDSIQKGVFPKNRLYTWCSETSCTMWEPCTGLKVGV